MDVMDKKWLYINNKNKTIMKILFFQNYLNTNIDNFIGNYINEGKISTYIYIYIYLYCKICSFVWID